MSDQWPSPEELLALTREASEHRRAWALVTGLSKALIRQNKAQPKSPPKAEEYVARIKDLEAKVIKQKAHLRELEDVIRPFEAETERLLIMALRAILTETHLAMTAPAATVVSVVQQYADKALKTAEARHGPRPIRDDEPF